MSRSDCSRTERKKYIPPKEDTPAGKESGMKVICLHDFCVVSHLFSELCSFCNSKMCVIVLFIFFSGSLKQKEETDGESIYVSNG
jgi:hypothetical protein